MMNCLPTAMVDAIRQMTPCIGCQPKFRAVPGLFSRSSYLFARRPSVYSDRIPAFIRATTKPS